MLVLEEFSSLGRSLQVRTFILSREVEYLLTLIFVKHLTAKIFSFLTRYFRDTHRNLRKDELVCIYSIVCI